MSTRLRRLTRLLAEWLGRVAKRPGLARSSFEFDTVSTKTSASRGAVIREAGARGPFPPFTPPGIFLEDLCTAGRD